MEGLSRQGPDAWVSGDVGLPSDHGCMQNWKRVLLGLGSVAVGSALTLAAVRERKAEAEYERCVAHWSAESTRAVDPDLERACADLDAALGNQSGVSFAPERWTSADRERLEADLALVEPALVRAAALVESERANGFVRSGQGNSLHRAPSAAFEWSQRFVARAVCADTDEDAAHWLATAFGWNALRGDSSLVGIATGAATDAVVVHALRERLCQPRASAAPYVSALDEHLARLQGPTSWREVGATEARALVSSSTQAGMVSARGPIGWWRHGSELRALCEALRFDEHVAAGAAPESIQTVDGIQRRAFESVASTLDWSRRTATLARVALRITARRDAGIALPQNADDARTAFATAGDVTQLVYTLTSDTAEISMASSGGTAPIEHWTIPLN